VAGVTRTLVRIAIAGVACALLLLLGGAILERAMLGGAPAEARVRVEQEVRDLFAVRSQRLKESARRAAPVDTVKRALNDDVAATRELFAAARATLPTTATMTPRSRFTTRTGSRWRGLDGRRNCASKRSAATNPGSFSRAALGLRLVYVAPLIDGPPAWARSRPSLPAQRR
jgi:hypothetical protein